MGFRALSSQCRSGDGGDHPWDTILNWRLGANNVYKSVLAKFLFAGGFTLNISFFCPENNINDNPSIGAIIDVLCEKGHTLNVVVGRRAGPKSGNLKAPHPRAKLHSVDASFFETGYLNKTPPFDTSLADLNIGIDADGVIIAAHFSQKDGIPLGMISYEIFFSSETNPLNKNKEIEACRAIKFAVVSDPVRGQLLCQENHIPAEKLIYIPVAARRVARGERHYLLHDRLEIPRDKKIAILAGSICRWTMADRIVRSAVGWPPNWTLVLHSRYGPDAIEPFVLSLVNRQNANVIISKRMLELSSLDEILRSVELGLAFYEPTFKSEYHGKNIANIGFSSGKIATYLQHGVPVACNEIGPMANSIRRYDLGVVADAPEELPSLLRFAMAEDRREKCFDFFQNYLALEHNEQTLLSAVENLM